MLVSIGQTFRILHSQDQLALMMLFVALKWYCAEDGHRVYGQDLDMLSKMILGPEGKEVKLGFSSADGMFRQVNIVRSRTILVSRCVYPL